MTEQQVVGEARGCPQGGCRYRITFAKRGALRFIGHLDLQRGIERTLRRAKVPLLMTKGFHPRPRLQFAAALPLGQAGLAELLDIWLDEPRDAAQLCAALRATTPPDLEFLDVEELGEGAPKIAKLIHAAEYLAHLPAEIDREPLGARVRSLLAAEALPRERRDKPYDLRPLIAELALVEQGLSMTLTLGNASTGRPEEVLRALELVPERYLIERVRLLLEG